MEYRDDLIRAEKAARRLTDQALAELAGVSRSTVSLACNGKSIGLRALSAIVSALGIEMAEVFKAKDRAA